MHRYGLIAAVVAVAGFPAAAQGAPSAFLSAKQAKQATAVIGLAYVSASPYPAYTELTGIVCHRLSRLHMTCEYFTGERSNSNDPNAPTVIRDCAQVIDVRLRPHARQPTTTQAPLSCHGNITYG